MPQIKFLKDFPHADDGINVVTYKADAVLEVSDCCAAAAIRTGAGVDPNAEHESAPETKARGAAPRNKAK